MKCQDCLYWDYEANDCIHRESNGEACELFEDAFELDLSDDVTLEDSEV